MEIKDKRNLILTVFLGIVIGIVASRFYVQAGLSVLFLTIIGALKLFKKSLNVKKYEKLRDQVSDDIKLYKEHKLTRLLFYIATFLMPFLIIRPVSSITLSDILYVICMMMVFLKMLLKHRISYYKLNPWLIFGLCLFVAGALLSSFGADSPVTSIARAARVPFILVFWFSLSLLILKSEKQVYIAFICWVSSVAFNGFIATLQLGIDIPYTVNFFGRMTAYTGNISDLGAITSIVWIPALVLATSLKGKKSFLSYVLLIFVGMGVILSGSVSGLITSIIGTVVWFLIGRPSFKFIVLSGLFVLLLSVVIQIQESKGLVTPMSRFASTTSTATNDENGTLMSRLSTYKVAAETIKKDPYIGVGFDGKETETGFGVHNLFLATWYQGGVLSFAGLLIICGTIIRLGIETIRQSKSKIQFNLSLALLMSFLCVIIFGMTAPFLYQRYIWIPVALLLPLNLITNKKEKETQYNSSQVV
ncbi:O-antigen ligase [Bacillus sp. OV194]|nr:O-antigen ligase [Bacillus sp. OV194]